MAPGRTEVAALLSGAGEEELEPAPEPDELEPLEEPPEDGAAGLVPVLPPEEGWAAAPPLAAGAEDEVELLPPADEKLPPVQPSMEKGPAKARSGELPSSKASKRSTINVRMKIAHDAIEGETYSHCRLCSRKGSPIRIGQKQH